MLLPHLRRPELPSPPLKKRARLRTLDYAEGGLVGGVAFTPSALVRARPTREVHAHFTPLKGAESRSVAARLPAPRTTVHGAMAPILLDDPADHGARTDGTVRFVRIEVSWPSEPARDGAGPALSPAALVTCGAFILLMGATAIFG